MSRRQLGADGLLTINGRTAPGNLLAHTSPLGWSHISLTGDYLWDQAATAVDGFKVTAHPMRREAALEAGLAARASLMAAKAR